MPRYQVLKRGFFNNELYDPDGKRRVLHSNMPLKPVPSWLSPMPEEKPVEKQSRTVKSKKQAEADAKKDAEEKVEKDSVTFTEPQPTVTQTI